MSTAVLAKRVDTLLKSLGFDRAKLTWTRRSGLLIDVVDVQVSKSGEAVTINAGVFDPEVFARCWGADPPTPIDETSCAVRARIGQLMPDDKDLWWPIDDDETPEHVADALAGKVVPFVESMHSREAMVQWLKEQGVVRQKYPAPIIYLAILLHLNGDELGACSLLSDLHRKALGAWRARAGEVSARLGCT
jgi:hypothetical protein